MERIEDNFHRYRYLAVDIDGTLANSDKEIDPATKEALLDLQESGYTIMLTSGRSSRGLQYYIDELQLKKYKGYILSYNGACMEDVATGRLIFKKTINRMLASSFLEFWDKYDFPRLVYGMEKLYTDQPNSQIAQHLSQTNRLEVVAVEDFRILLPEEPLKILIYGEEEKLHRVTDECQIQYTDQLSLTFSDPTFFQAMRLGVNKGVGLLQLNRYFKVNPDLVIAFGDGANDIEMLEQAGLGIAMANAIPQAKEAADLIAEDDNDNGGVVKTLEKLGLLAEKEEL